MSVEITERLLKLEKFNEEKFVKHSSYKLQSKFDKFNKELFDGNLPQIKLTFKSHKGKSGTCRASYLKSDRILQPEEITMEKRFERSEEGFDTILVHEMIHLHNMVEFPDYNEYIRQCDKGGHGIAFVKKAKELETKLGRPIPITDAMKDANTNPVGGTEYPYVVAIGVIGGREQQWIATFSKKLFRTNLEHVKDCIYHRFGGGGLEGDNDVKISYGYTTNPFIGEIKKQINLARFVRFYRLDDEQLAYDLYDEGTRIDLR